MSYRVSLVLALLLSSSAIGRASVLDHARFLKLHPEVARLVSKQASFALASFQIIGERIVMENGHLSVSVEKVRGDDLKIDDLKAHTTYTLDDDFFEDPVKALVESFLKASETTIARMEMKASLSDDEPQGSPDRSLLASVDVASVDPDLAAIRSRLAETFTLDVVMRDVKMPLSENAFTLTAKVLVFSLKALGEVAYDATNKKLVATLTSVKMGGVPVALDLAFLVMGRFVAAYDFISLEKPRIFIDLGAFLP